MAFTYLAEPVGTMGTIIGKSKRYDEPDGKVSDKTDNDDVVRSLIMNTTTPTGKWVGFISNDPAGTILFVKDADIKGRFIAVPDDVIKSIASRTLSFLEVQK